MSSYKITCRDCGQPISHECNEDFAKALFRLLTWVPEGCFASPEIYEAFKAESERQQDDYDFTQYPFYGSQAWTYLIWHKEDARTFHALLKNLMRSAGIDPHEMDMKVNAHIKEQERQREEYKKRKAEMDKRRAERKAKREQENHG